MAHAEGGFQSLPVVGAFGLVAGDARGHFVVTGLGRSDKEDRAIPGQAAGQFQGVVALAAACAAEDEVERAVSGGHQMRV